jgi:hypothetical protein
MTADPTPAADSRLAELTEALRTIMDDTLEGPVGLVVMKPELAARTILALLPARTATTEAEALAAIGRLDEQAWWRLDKSEFAKDAERYMVTVPGPQGVGLGPTIPDAIAAALAVTGGDE